MYERGFLKLQKWKEKDDCFCLEINSRAFIILSLRDEYGESVQKGRQANQSFQFIGELI